MWVQLFIELSQFHKDCAYFFFNKVGDSNDIFLMQMWLEGEEVNIYFVSTFCNYTNNCQTLKVNVSKPLEQNGALNRRGCLVVVGEISQLLVQKQFSNILLIAKIIQVMFTNNLCMVFLITSIFHLYSSLSLFYLSSGTNVAILIDIALVTLNFKLYFHGGHFSTWAVSLSFLTPSTWGSRF